MKKRLVAVLPVFRHEVDDILDHSSEEFGPEQSFRYEELITEALDLLEEHAELGIARPDVHPDARIMPIAKRGGHARHVLLYRFNDERVEVASCAHGSRQLTAPEHWVESPEVLAHLNESLASPLDPRSHEEFWQEALGKPKR